MRSGYPIVALHILAFGLYLAQGADFSANQQLAEETENFVDCTKNIPASVLSLCADSKGRIAAPGEKWNATDEIDERLPRNLLIWATVRSNSFSDTYYVHYETGGFVDSWYVIEAVVGRIDHKTRLIGVVDAGPFMSYDKFISKLKEHKFMPNQSSHPTPALGTSRAGHEPRHR